LCRRARGRRGGGLEYHVSILPESVRLAIHQYALGETQRSQAGESARCVRNKQFAAGPANAVPAAASSPLQTATAPGRELIQMPLWARRIAAARADVLDALAHFTAAKAATAGLGGKSPNQAASGGEVRRIGDERALALLAEHAVRRRIGREGIALEGARFVAAELGAYVGQDVTVFPDPSGDMGVVHVLLETRAGHGERARRMGPNP
jgi:hypothetical protein